MNCFLFQTVFTVWHWGFTLFFSSLKFDALCQREFFGIVDGAGGAAHILLPCIWPWLTSTPSVLLATKCSADFSPIGGNVDIDDTTVRSLGSQPLSVKERNSISALCNSRILEVDLAYWKRISKVPKSVYFRCNCFLVLHLLWGTVQVDRGVNLS